MKALIGIALLLMLMISSCAKKSSFPSPYAGYTHTSGEHGYWREISNGKLTVGEFHLHDKGYSVTYEPFETFKDYWGYYAFDESKQHIIIEVKSGNTIPEQFDGNGKMYIGKDGDLVVDGVNLDTRRPDLKVFKFRRFEPTK